MHNRKSRSGYLSAGATSILLFIAISAIVYVTVRITNWYNNDKADSKPEFDFRGEQMYDFSKNMKAEDYGIGETTKRMNDDI